MRTVPGSRLGRHPGRYGSEPPRPGALNAVPGPETGHLDLCQETSNECPRVLPAAPGAGPAVLAAELLGRVRAELPVIGGLGEREQVLVSAWLTGLRSARTRRAYAGDVAAWPGWLDAGAAASRVRRRLSALSSFYWYCAAHDLIGRVPTHGVARPMVDPDYTATVGLDRDQARALVAAAAVAGTAAPQDPGPGGVTVACRNRA